MTERIMEYKRGPTVVVGDIIKLHLTYLCILKNGPPASFGKKTSFKKEKSKRKLQRFFSQTSRFFLEESKKIAIANLEH